ncbi:thioredoxin family protein [Dinoroseobacter sp. PD6]|uniref:thioredoxin family protein n=1 Tax=Dinoroseobacter sp. PD6 TaxID=3028384 RepID=UPI00237C1CEF|nr:thioredoxin family protein [Dinoroseobacter sp. PD6]MDD9717861.1 thioredoxin family protein [Dinoroseobacter sp. PD6]
MNRREILALGAAFVTAPMAAQAMEGAKAYTPGMVDAALARGETVFLDFKASWCSTCAAQGRVLSALKAEMPGYTSSITFIDVDWDEFKDAEITRRLEIPRRSTLVVLKGDEELGRIVAGTGKEQIKALMDTALAAATS